jgi:serine/threonine protein kinase
LLGYIVGEEATKIAGHVEECPKCQDDAEGLQQGSLLAASAEKPEQMLEKPQQSDEMGRLGSYRVLRVLGSGGMGVVFEAEDERLHRRVALKVLLPEDADNSVALERFRREAEAIAALGNDHIIAIHQVSEAVNRTGQVTTFLDMPLLRGDTLEARLKSVGRLPIAEVLRIGREIANGLAAAHEAGLVHRDIKPSNIWLEEGGDRVKILDFGLAKILDPGLVSRRVSGAHQTQPGAIMGTLGYMAPEQAAGGVKIDHRADLFSLGRVLFYMATGCQSSQGDSSSATQFDMDKPRREVPRPLSDLIERLLAKDPAERPPNAFLVRDELSRLETVLVEAELSRLEQAERGSRTAAWSSGQPKLRYTIRRDLPPVQSLAFSPDGKTLASTDHDTPVRFWDAASGGEAPHSGSSRVRSVKFLKNGKLAAGGKGEPIFPWDLASGEVTVTFPKTPQFVVASPDGRTLATARSHGHKWSKIQLWDVAGDKAPLSVGADSVAFSPDGKTLAAVDREGVTFWDVAGPAGAWTGLPGTCEAFSPEGKALAVVNRKGVILWDVASRRKTATLPMDLWLNPRKVLGPDGKTLAVVGSDVTLWSAEDGRRIAILQEGGFPEDAAFSPDGKTLAVVARQGGTLWDVAGRRKTATLPMPRGGWHPTGQDWRVAFSPDSKTLAVVDWESVTLWDVVGRRITASLTMDLGGSSRRRGGGSFLGP